MRNSYRLFLLAVLVTFLVFPLWFEKSFDVTQSIAQRVEALLVPTATAAVIVPAVVRDATSMPQPQFDAARLLMVGTVLFGLAAVVRKSI